MLVLCLAVASHLAYSSTVEVTARSPPCGVTLVKQRAKSAPCVAASAIDFGAAVSTNATFGCGVAPGNTSSAPSMWAQDGCTGVFECPSGAKISCGKAFGSNGCKPGACSPSACSCEANASLWGRGPAYQACTTALAKSLPYCDTTLSIEARAAWIVANLTLKEKIAQIR
jgi:hypothetical protein